MLSQSNYPITCTLDSSLIKKQNYKMYKQLEFLDDYQEVVNDENVTDQRLLLPSSTIHWSNAFSNLLEVLPILLLNHLVALLVLAGVMQIKHVWWPVEKQSITINPAYCLLF